MLFLAKAKNKHGKYQAKLERGTVNQDRKCVLVRLGAPILFVACLTSAHAETPLMARYMDCAKAIGVAINDKFTVLQGERSGHRGLFVYTTQNAYFLPLGAPHAEDSQAQEFILRTSISDVGDILLNFRDRKPQSKSNIQAGISYQITNPPTGIHVSYQAATAYDSLDHGASDLLRERLAERVATIKDFIDDKNRYSTPADAKSAFEKDRAIYLARLERCRIKGDLYLNSVVAEETKKLKLGFPGITIWEKQVDGGLTAAQSR